VEAFGNHHWNGMPLFTSSMASRFAQWTPSIHPIMFLDGEKYAFFSLAALELALNLAGMWM